jgi:hypothetical protein
MANEQAGDAWDEYLTGPVPPEGGMNWEAYSHDELYQMLWRDADVADVSTVAAEWAQHRAALNTHAEVLREQAVALQDSWHGPAAEEAANRLDALAVRMEKISELAGAGQQAAQEAADALASARAMMPPPPGANPAAPFAELPAMPALPSAPALPAVPTLPSFAPAPAMFAPPPAPSMDTAFGAVGSGGFSFYFGAATQDQQKAQAVHAMQTYESRLMGGSRMIDEARSAIPPATSAAHATAAPAQGAPAAAGVPWDRLVAPGPSSGVSTGVGTGPVIGGTPGPGSVLGPGGRMGALPGMPGSALLPTPHLAAEAAARAGAPGGMVPPVGGQRGDSENERHENLLPKLGHGLFDVDVETSGSVIGGEE